MQKCIIIGDRKIRRNFYGQYQGDQRKKNSGIPGAETHPFFGLPFTFTVYTASNVVVNR